VDGRGLKGILGNFDLEWKFLHPNTLHSRSFHKFPNKPLFVLKAAGKDQSMLARKNIYSDSTAYHVERRCQKKPLMRRINPFGFPSLATDLQYVVVD
jgi:hypothetical protein